MNGFISLTDVDNGTKAMPVSAIRLLEDIVAVEGESIGRTCVTLCDGSQFVVKGDVAGILKQIESTEPL